MTRPNSTRWARLAFVPLLALLGFAGSLTSPSNAQDARPRRMLSNGVPDTGQFLPDTMVLVRVDDRRVTVWDYRDGYYAIYPTMRPEADSAGRVEFLGNIVRKEVLGITARRVNRPLDFADRAKIRQYGNRLLGNLLYMRAVGDSVDLSEAAVERIYGFYGRELRMRHLFFVDRDVAERTRMRLLAGQLTWSAANAAYGMRDSTGRPVASEQQWVRFESVPPDIGVQIWPLRVGEFSPLILSPGGYHLVQLSDSRPRKDRPIIEALRSSIEIVLRQVQVRRLRKQVQAEAMVGFDLQFDSTAIHRAAKRFNASMSVTNDGFGTSFNIDASVPELSEEEKALVLARWNGRQDSLTFASAVHEYSDLPILGRPSLNTPEDLQEFCLNTILEPRLVEVAIRRGLQNDSTYKVLLARKEEEIRVTHMVEDSVFSRISVTEADRRQYYKDHLESYRTFPSIRYALVLAGSKGVADSIKAVFDSGADAGAVVAAYQKKFGDDRAKVDVEQQNQPTMVHKNLFEELKPGRSTVNGPDRLGQYYTVKSIARDDGQILPYEQVLSYVEESLQNSRAEAALEAFVDRLRKSYSVTWRPELVMRIRLVDTASK